MPNSILAFIRNESGSATKAVGNGVDDQPGLRQIIEFLRFQGGHDFRSYKQSTLNRRIHRRLGLQNMETVADYLSALRSSPAQVLALTGDLMISVTSFFRDPEAWKALAELVIAPLVAERPSGASLRIWIPSCSTGEEAYSIAILVTELGEAIAKTFDLKIFATDVQELNLSRARAGIYPQAALSDFEASRLQRFFDPLESSWQVTKQLRDMIVFAPQNLLLDPPFSQLDFVSCRNFLIYLEPEAQQRVIAVFHFALVQGGHLFLGSAETIGRHEELFEVVSKKWRLYRKSGPTRHDLIKYQRSESSVAIRKRSSPQQSASESPASMADVARGALLDHYAPTSVLIDRRCRVLYFHGATCDYLAQPTGEPTRDLFAMVRAGLALKLRAAIRKTTVSKMRVTFIAWAQHDKTSPDVIITVTPLANSSDGFALVSFAPVSVGISLPLQMESDQEEDRLIGERALQDELMRSSNRQTKSSKPRKRSCSRSTRN